MKSPKATAKVPAKAPAQRGTVARPIRRAASGGGFTFEMNEADDRDADFTRLT
ncbi:hypothetical protein [Methylobacterium aquaticum]|uniref:hypothetical protein n=1 Tax=Methylobacterium aquaticum TaxID=270351 RepID=UPI00193450FF